MHMLSPSNLLWIGVDVSKATFDAALWGHQDFQRMATGSALGPWWVWQR